MHRSFCGRCRCSLAPLPAKTTFSISHIPSADSFFVSRSTPSLSITNMLHSTENGSLCIGDAGYRSSKGTASTYHLQHTHSSHVHRQSSPSCCTRSRCGCSSSPRCEIRRNTAVESQLLDEFVTAATHAMHCRKLRGNIPRGR